MEKRGRKMMRLGVGRSRVASMCDEKWFKRQAIRWGRGNTFEGMVAWQ